MYNQTSQCDVENYSINYKKASMEDLILNLLLKEKALREYEIINLLGKPVREIEKTINQLKEKKLLCNAKYDDRCFFLTEEGVYETQLRFNTTYLHNLIYQFSSDNVLNAIELANIEKFLKSKLYDYYFSGNWDLEESKKEFFENNDAILKKSLFVR